MFHNFSVYIDQARSTSDTSLTFNIATGGTWKFKVSQIECGNPSLAMPGCDQWFMGSSGTIMSYNYPKTVLSNTRTVTCIRRNEGKNYSTKVFHKTEVQLTPQE